PRGCRRRALAPRPRARAPRARSPSARLRPGDRRRGRPSGRARSAARRGACGASSVARQRRALPRFDGGEACLPLGLLARPVPDRDLVVGGERTIGEAGELVLVEGERPLVMCDVLARLLRVEVSQAEHVSGKVLRIGVLLDEEAERLLGGLVTTLEVTTVIDDQPGRRAL